MPHYEFFCHTCNRPFSKMLPPNRIEGKHGRLCALWQRGSAQQWFYPVTARQIA